MAKSSKVLQGTGIEEDKRDLINREIGKFRKTAEVIQNVRENLSPKLKFCNNSRRTNKRKRKKKIGKSGKSATETRIQEPRRRPRRKKRKSHAEEVDPGLEKREIGNARDVNAKRNVNIGNASEKKKSVKGKRSD